MVTYDGKCADVETRTMTEMTETHCAVFGATAETWRATAETWRATAETWREGKKYVVVAG